MNIYLFNLIILILIPRLINGSTSCSIFVSLNCSCFQSDNDLRILLPQKTYSHLYCKGNSLDGKTFLSPFGSDFKYQNRFRTVSIEFSLDKQIQIETNQFNSLAMLFSQTDLDAQIEISLHFNGFTHIKLNKQSITSNIFQRKHQNKRLSLHFVPKTSNYFQIETGERNSTSFNDQFTFIENCFSGLIVSHLNVYLHTLRDSFSSSSFEQIFNNTNIGELHFHGSLISPGSFNSRQTFKGLIRSLTLHRHVETIDSNTYPYYFSVYSYNMQSIEAHSMNLKSFIPIYTNLRGLELIKPHFEVSIDQLIPTLDSLSLDIEYFNERTLLGARHIHNFKLGSQLRRISAQVLYNLPNRLRHFDLSDIDLSEMTSDSRCYLIDFISKKSQSQLNLILPRIETLTECDCARLILNDIQLKRNFQENLSNDHSCSERCLFSDCPIISEYFREKDLLLINNQPFYNVLNDSNHDNLPSVDLYSDANDTAMIHFLRNQTNDEQMNLNFRRSTIKPLTKFSDSEEDEFISSDEETNEFSKSKRKKSFSWLLFLISILIVLFIILITVSIIFYIVRRRKRQYFKAVPVYV